MTWDTLDDPSVVNKITLSRAQLEEIIEVLTQPQIKHVQKFHVVESLNEDGDVRIQLRFNIFDESSPS